jgi:ABC-type nitrate/sulfonate/bicarbonate transport system substrate-binding protein
VIFVTFVVRIVVFLWLRLCRAAPCVVKSLLNRRLTASKLGDSAVIHPDKQEKKLPGSFYAYLRGVRQQQKTIKNPPASLRRQENIARRRGSLLYLGSKPVEDKTKMTLTQNSLAILCFAFLVSVGSITRAANAEEVTLSYTASTLTFLAGRIALDQNFFRQEGLDVKFIQMRTAANIPALANGHVDYTMSFLPPIDSALRGLPIQMMAVFVDRSLHYLVTKPNIKSSADLRGKTFALNTVDLNGSTGLVFQAVLRHFGVDPLKDVKWISAADSPALFTMVEQGIADATFLVPPWPQKARTAGLRVLFRSGDVYSAPLAGLSTYRRTLKEKPDQVRRMLRALVRATRFMLQPGNQQAVAGTIQQWLRMPMDEGTQALKDVMFAYSDGLPRDEKTFWEIVGARAKLMSSTVPVSEVADFSFVKEIRTP